MKKIKKWTTGLFKNQNPLLPEEKPEWMKPWTPRPKFIFWGIIFIIIVFALLLLNAKKNPVRSTPVQSQSSPNL